MYEPPKKSSVSVAEAQKKMEYYCAYQDRCHQEIEEKLRTMHLIPEARELIILHLLQHNFLNEERFAKSYARGKFRIKKWGKQRIVRELKYRKISEYLIRTALKEIKDADYYATFHQLAEKKFESVTETNPQRKEKKLINYLQYRGWESNLIFEKVNNLFGQ